jgi:tRNA (guanine9-N1)-methyltransferase
MSGPSEESSKDEDSSSSSSSSFRDNDASEAHDPEGGHSGESRKRRREMSPESLRTYWRRKKAEKKQRKKERAAARQEQQRLHWSSLTDAEKDEIRAKALAAHEFRHQQEVDLEKRCSASLADPNTPALLFDLSFADLMNTGGVKSTTSQAKLSVALLRRHGFAFRPIITSIHGPFESFRSFEGFKRYPPVMTSMHWRDLLEGSSALTQTSEASDSNASMGPHVAILRKADVVYLTADSDVVLMDIEPRTVYIVGTFVDHNSKKGATLQLARSVGVRTARLPIDEFIKVGNLCKVLTVNTVVDVLCRFVETKNWLVAFEALPTRRV